MIIFFRVDANTTIGTGHMMRCINLANKLFITRVHGVFDCDTFFPEINLNEWRIISQEKRNENDINFTFERYIRILYKNKGCAD